MVQSYNGVVTDFLHDIKINLYINTGSFEIGNMSHFKNHPLKKGTKYIVSQKGVLHV